MLSDCQWPIIQIRSYSSRFIAAFAKFVRWMFFVCKMSESSYLSWLQVHIRSDCLFAASVICSFLWRYNVWHLLNGFCKSKAVVILLLLCCKRLHSKLVCFKRYCHTEISCIFNVFDNGEKRKKYFLQKSRCHLLTLLINFFLRIRDISGNRAAANIHGKKELRFLQFFLAC